MDLFRKQMERGKGVAFADDNLTNYRLIQPQGDRTIYHVEMPSAGSNAAGVVILLLILIGICVAAFVFHRQGRLVFKSAQEAAANNDDMKRKEDVEFSGAAVGKDDKSNTAPV